MDTDLDLPQLIAAKDHLNVLRYIRIHQLREPELVVHHGKALMGGPKLTGSCDTPQTTLAVIEQICLASLDVVVAGKEGENLADVCLSVLSDRYGIDKKSVRFRMLVGRCKEAYGDNVGADKLYKDLLLENPSNKLAQKRRYCILKSTPGKLVEAATALHEYVESNFSDTPAWYELAQLRQRLGDAAGYTYCLEQVVLACPADSYIHTLLGEGYAERVVTGAAAEENLRHLQIARQHMAQAYDLDPSNVRAKYGLVVIANRYLVEESNAPNKVKEKSVFDVSVATEIVKFGTEQVIGTYTSSSTMKSHVQQFMKEYI